MDQKHCFFPCKFADLRLADGDTKETCGLIVANLRICDLRTPQKFASPRVRGFVNCEIKKNMHAHLCLFESPTYIHLVVTECEMLYPTDYPPPFPATGSPPPLCIAALPSLCERDLYYGQIVITYSKNQKKKVCLRNHHTSIYFPSTMYVNKVKTLKLDCFGNKNLLTTLQHVRFGFFTCI